MNMDIGLVNRALQNIGNAPLSTADKTAGNSAWVTAKAYYLETMLEALSAVEWTSAKRRRILMPSKKPFKTNSAFAHAFDMPLDCAKPISLEEGAYFVVESDLLYTDAETAALLYITNGKRLIDQEIVTGGPLYASGTTGGAKRGPKAPYFSGGDARRRARYEAGDNILVGKKHPTVPPIPTPLSWDEDFPEYQALGLDPQFFVYWEKMLSAKYAMKVTDKPELHTAFLQEAAMIGQGASQASIAQGAAKIKPPALWADALGLR
jgi:hypothetical protein